MDLLEFLVFLVVLVVLVVFSCPARKKINPKGFHTENFSLTMVCKKFFPDKKFLGAIFFEVKNIFLPPKTFCRQVFVFLKTALMQTRTIVPVHNKREGVV